MTGALRTPGWRERLMAFLTSQRGVAFSWADGRDCCLFGADAVAVMSGTDFAASLRGQYTTRFGALRALKRRGFDSVHDFVAAQLAPASRAACGNIAVMASTSAYLHALGICDGQGRVWHRDENRGLILTKLPADASLWSV